MLNENSFIVLIPCAGTGVRFGGEIPKQYISIENKSLLEHTLNAFIEIKQISSIVLIASADDAYINYYQTLSNKISILKVGGKTRAETVLNGLNALSCKSDDWILVHDAVRCCIKSSVIEKMLETLKNDAVGGILAIKATDTVKEVNNNIITHTLNRQQIYLAQTPQMFRYIILKKALANADLSVITDEANAVEQMGYHIKVIEGESTNIKITYPVDLLFAKALLSSHVKS